MTNLLIGYPQISVDATAVTTVAAFSSLQPEKNVISGPRTMYAELAAAGTSAWVKFDIGSSQSKTIDFFYVARAKIAQKLGSLRCLLDASTDDITYNNVCGRAADFQSLTLLGPRSEDALFTSGLANSTAGSLSTTISKRYWRTWFAGNGADPSKKYAVSKIMFGAWLDMGREPLLCERTEIKSPFDRESRSQFRIGWYDISKTVKDNAIAALITKAENGCILYTASYHEILFNYRIVHCRVTDYDEQCTTEARYNLIITFEEMV